MVDQLAVLGQLLDAGFLDGVIKLVRADRLVIAADVTASDVASDYPGADDALGDPRGWGRQGLHSPGYAADVIKEEDWRLGVGD